MFQSPFSYFIPPSIKSKVQTLISNMLSISMQIKNLLTSNFRFHPFNFSIFIPSSNRKCEYKLGQIVRFISDLCWSTILVCFFHVDDFLGFDGSSKIYVEFKSLDMIKAVIVKGRQMIADSQRKIPNAVYEAIRMRQLRQVFSLTVLPYVAIIS